MDVRAREDSDAAPMRSEIHWAVLGLIIERPGYGYDLAQRFERAYGGLLRLSGASYMYNVLGVLKGRGFIDELPGKGGGRQPKPLYRATSAGVETYQAQLISEAGEDRRRSCLFTRRLAVFVREPEAALEVVARYRDACLKQALAVTASAETELDPATKLASRLEVEERRLAITAQLEWCDYAERELVSLGGHDAKP